MFLLLLWRSHFTGQRTTRVLPSIFFTSPTITLHRLQLKNSPGIHRKSLLTFQVILFHVFLPYALWALGISLWHRRTPDLKLLIAPIFLTFTFVYRRLHHTFVRLNECN